VTEIETETEGGDGSDVKFENLDVWKKAVDLYEKID
jgi:hypothetical protein